MYEKSVAINTLSETSKAFSLKSRTTVSLLGTYIHHILQIEPIKRNKRHLNNKDKNAYIYYHFE